MPAYESALGWVDDLFHLFGRTPPPNLNLYIALSTILIPIPILLMFLSNARPRFASIPPYRERVLILGATSGVGEELAYQYAARGCRGLVLVGRRGKELERVKAKCEEKRKEGEEWDQSQQAPGWEDVGETVHVVEADCTLPEDLVKVRQVVRRALGGLDTLHITFGVSALRPLLNLAGVDPLTQSPSSSSSPHATLEGISKVLFKTTQIHTINAAATAAVLATFIPLLQLTSALPTIVLLSSVAAFVPPPTRSLYGASKAAQLHLFQATAVEAQAQAEKGTPRRADIAFLAMAPATIRTSFRQSAIDIDGEPGGGEAPKDAAWDDKKGSSEILEAAEVAKRSIKCADKGVRGVVALPGKYRVVRWIYPIVPGPIDRFARRKYGY